MGEAEKLIEQLRGVAPQHATSHTVGAYERAVDLLDRQVGSPLWFEAVTGLGSHLLESPDGDRSENIHRALAAYGRALAVAAEEGHREAFTVAGAGVANALMTDPTAGPEALAEAISLLEEIASAYRSAGEMEALAVTLGQLAAAHAKMPVGDLTAHLDTAISLQEEAVRILADGGPGVATTRGRARHNLAVLHTKRRTGLRSQNVDRAVRLLLAALEDRPAESDPVGRARTLRGLALLCPEWTGADSLEHARHLADAAADQAQLLEQGDDVSIARGSGWAYLERQQSALNVDLDDLYSMEHEYAVEWLDGAIANHVKALGVYAQESMPLRWAEWMGGLGRLLGRGPSLGDWSQVEAAHSCFAQALEAFVAEEHPLLGRQLLERWGELCHEIGDFQRSLDAHRRALDLSDLLLRSIVDPDHRLIEIKESRLFALFAAYAASNLGQTRDALAMAERQRMRLQGDLICAREALAEPGARRTEILAAVADVQRLEQKLAKLDDRDPDAQMERQAGRLADYLAIDPSLIRMRRIDPGADDPSPVAGERERLSRDLSAARTALLNLLAPALADAEPPVETADQIVDVARASGCALVYLLATVHGGAAIAALPDGVCDVLLLGELTSDLARALVHGTESAVGFADAALLGRVDALPGCLAAVTDELAPALFGPLNSWLHARGVEQAALVTLGSLGLLPLHMAAGSDILYTYGPCASVLRSGSTVKEDPLAADLLVFADPTRDDVVDLPLSVAESRAIQALVPNRNRATVLTGPEATAVKVRELAATARHVHFGCHGTFRPSQPLTSELLLAGEDRLSVADVFSGEVDLSACQLVTLLACRSGNVEFRSTPDECLSFPGALLVGGVRSVVSTMWRVEDSASAFFTLKLYDYLYGEGIAPAAAVTKARTWLKSASAAELVDLVAVLRSHVHADDLAALSELVDLSASLAGSFDERPYAAPQFWGPYIYTGLP